MNSTKSSASSKKSAHSSSANGGHASGISDGLRLAGVEFAGDILIARFSNGSSVSVKVNRYPHLQNATPAQRNHWRLIGKGSGVHWKSLDEDLSMENFLFASAKVAA